MSEGEGLGETWCLATAIDYVHRIEGYELEQEFYRAAFDDETLQIAARPPVEEVRRYPSQRSIDGLLLALRDGYVRATGRLGVRAALMRKTAGGFMQRTPH